MGTVECTQMHSPLQVCNHPKSGLHVPVLFKAFVAVAFFLVLYHPRVHAQESVTTQADTKLATTVNDATVRENKFLFPVQADGNNAKHTGRYGFGSPTGSSAWSMNSTPTSKRPISEASAWTKAKEYMSDHTDEITELGTFLIEKYVTGGESSAETTRNSGGASNPSK